MKHIISMAGLAAFVAIAVQAQVQPVLQISFDSDFNGIGSAGPVTGSLLAKPELAPGKFGQ